MSATPTSVRALWRAGLAGVRRYTGTLFGVYIANLAVTLVCWFAIWMVLANALARLPMFDAAVDGDVIALIHVLRAYKQVFFAVGALGFGLVLLWWVLSTFLYAGLIAVLAERPEGRSATARSFGGGGAASFLRCLRLLGVSLLMQVSTFVVFGLCVGAAAPGLERALSGRDLIAPLLLALGPPLLLTHLLWTVADYARVELVLHGERPGVGAVAAYNRAFSLVLRNPRTLVHGASGWLLMLGLTGGVWWLAHERAMYGAGGALILFAVRKGGALARMAIKMAMIGGQVELGKTRPTPGQAPPARAG